MSRRTTVADAMLVSPVLSPAAATAAEVRTLLDSAHRHVALVVDDRMLLSVVGRTDLAGADDLTPAARLGRLQGRVVGPAADLEHTRASMLAEGRRRLAVVDDAGRLLGLLCLKRHGQGFCTAETVAERDGS